MNRGILNGSFTGMLNKTFAQCWSLDETGNWSVFRQDNSGNGIWDLIQSRNSNPANEIDDIMEAAGLSWVTPEYSRSGNITKMPQPASPMNSYLAKYDAWNRLMSLVGGTGTVVAYAYDGVNRRIVQDFFIDGTLSEIRHCYYTDPSQWQLIEERMGASPDSENPSRQFVWGQRSLDDCVIRDRDVALVGSLDERIFVAQDANCNATGLFDPSGDSLKRIAYSPYGLPIFLSSTWSPEADTLGWDILFAGYHFDSSSGLTCVRNRYLHDGLGTWIQRDPAYYHDSHNLYLYALCNPLSVSDPTGAFVGSGLTGGTAEPGDDEVGKANVGGPLKKSELCPISPAWPRCISMADAGQKYTDVFCIDCGHCCDKKGCPNLKIGYGIGQGPSIPIGNFPIPIPLPKPVHLPYPLGCGEGACQTRKTDWECVKRKIQLPRLRRPVGWKRGKASLGYDSFDPECAAGSCDGC